MVAILRTSEDKNELAVYLRKSLAYRAMSFVKSNFTLHLRIARKIVGIYIQRTKEKRLSIRVPTDVYPEQDLSTTEINFLEGHTFCSSISS